MFPAALDEKLKLSLLLFLYPLQKTAGGIFLTSSSAPRLEDAQIGTVIAVGEDVDISVATGDLVLFTKYGSSDIEVPNGEVCFVAQKSIVAKLS